MGGELHFGGRSGDRLRDLCTSPVAAASVRRRTWPAWERPLQGDLQVVIDQLHAVDLLGNLDCQLFIFLAGDLPLQLDLVRS